LFVIRYYVHRVIHKEKSSKSCIPKLAVKIDVSDFN